MQKIKIVLFTMCFSLLGYSSGQGNLHLTNGAIVYIGNETFKSADKLYFYRLDTLFWSNKSEIAYLVKFKEWKTTTTGETQSVWDTVYWDNLTSKYVINEFTKINYYKQYANRSSAGIVMTLVVPAVTSVLALQQGVVEIAYVGLASSAIGIGLWISGIQKLRTALELGEAIHYTR